MKEGCLKAQCYGNIYHTAEEVCLYVMHKNILVLRIREVEEQKRVIKIIKRLGNGVAGIGENQYKNYVEWNS
jgi:hypothetical protein